jgi:hypothetical protein
LEQINNACLEDGCDTVAVAKFDTLAGYGGAVWGVCPCEGWTVSAGGCPVPPVVVTDDCRCGIKVQGANVDLATEGCIFDPMDAVNFDPVRFEVAVYEVTGSNDAIGTRPVPGLTTWEARTPSRKYLTGVEVMRDILAYREWRENENFLSPRTPFGYKMAFAQGLEYGVDPYKYYYAVYIPSNAHGQHANATMGLGENKETVLYFAEDDYAEMLKFMVAYNK